MVMLENSDLTDNEKSVLREFSKVYNDMKLIQLEKNKLSERVKEILTNHSLDKIGVDNCELSLTDRTTKTVLKKTKDEFMQELSKLNKGYLIIPSFEIDVDTLLIELENEDIDEEFVNKYVSITKSKVLNCK